MVTVGGQYQRGTVGVQGQPGEIRIFIELRRVRLRKRLAKVWLLLLLLLLLILVRRMMLMVIMIAWRVAAAATATPGTKVLPRPAVAAGGRDQWHAGPTVRTGHVATGPTTMTGRQRWSGPGRMRGTAVQSLLLVVVIVSGGPGCTPCYRGTSSVGEVGLISSFIGMER
uniref:Uncharacterized protein n=1 Tax=Anopheles atroparvus TaxID=41427 RepID=A0A182J941_ANOAO